MLKKRLMLSSTAQTIVYENYHERENILKIEVTTIKINPKVYKERTTSTSMTYIKYGYLIQGYGRSIIMKGDFSIGMRLCLHKM